MFVAEANLARFFLFFFLSERNVFKRSSYNLTSAPQN